MRVAVNVEQLLYRPPGGIGRYTARLVTLLPRLFPGDEVVTFCARHRLEELGLVWPPAGATGPMPLPARLPLPRPALYEAWNTLGVLRPSSFAVGPRRADVVHAPSVAVPPRGRAPLVVTVHDVAPLLFPETFPAHGRWFHARGLAAAARRADAVITVSEAARAEILACTSIPASRITVVPNGVDLVAATGAEVAAAVEARGLAGEPYVLWVGTIEPRKDVATLLAAAVAAGGEFRVALAGPSGWMSGDLVPPALAAALGDRLRPLGPVDESTLRALYAGAAALALPSRHEGFGLPVLEAMAQGTPVVCSDIASLREVAGGAARLVPVGDVDAWAAALVDVLGASGRERAAMAAAGRSRAAKLSWERTVASTRAVYVEVLSGAQ